MNKNYDELIAIEKDKIIAAKEHMELEREKFKRELAEFLRKQLPVIAKEIIVKFSKEAAKLTNEELGILKSKVQELVQRSEVIVDQYFDKTDLWWDLEENTFSYEVNNQQLPPIINTEVKYIIGQLGAIFSQYGIVSILPERQFKNVAHDSLFLIDEKRNEPYYRVHVSIDADTIEVMKQYNKHLNTIQSSRARLAIHFEEKRKSDIGDLWDAL